MQPLTQLLPTFLRLLRGQTLQPHLSIAEQASSNCTIYSYALRKWSFQSALFQSDFGLKINSFGLIKSSRK